MFCFKIGVLKVEEFISLYKNSSLVQTISEHIKANESEVVHIKGLHGSLDTVIASALHKLNHQTFLFILHDKEEAAYFQNDLQYLLGSKEVHFFPSSYKKPYEYEETENANVLLRAEILNRVNNKASTGEIIVTYPDALTESVINKKSLKQNTLTAKVGESLNIEFMVEVLNSYDFESTEFVYEAGQYSVRGGIVDIFSYANELPYRLEFFGDELESIRTFNPDSQLSVENIRQINIIPNVQTKLITEERQGFIDFLPNNTKLWFKDYEHCLDVISKSYDKAEGKFNEILEGSGNSDVVLNPQDLFENIASFQTQIKSLVKIEFGSRFKLRPDHTEFLNSESQPSFNKNFEMLAENLDEYQRKGYSNLLVSEQAKQIDRFTEIFDEIDPQLKFQGLIAGLRQGFIDHDEKIVCYTDHQIFERFHRYQLRKQFKKSKAITLKELKNLQPGDYVTHIDYGIGRFAGLEKVDVGGKMQEAVRLVYRDNDLLYVSIHSLHKISKHSGNEGVPPAISKLGSPEWENKKKKVKKKVADIAADLIQLYAKRIKSPGFAYTPDSFLQAELESSFIYEDTEDQSKATSEVKVDMEKKHPMDRLVCGDVGFGKTEVAIRAAFKAVADSKQVAILVPTTILAMQHFRTFSERLADFPVNIDYINRFRSTKSIKESIQKLENGQLDIIIGTHRIVNKDVKFKDLGLLIIDEEQKFGVKVKDRLKTLKVNVDVLTLTATPIPRTLHFSLMGARDLSIIRTPPPNRQPVTTEIHSFNEVLVRDSISFELRRGGQVFFVHNRIKDIEEVANIILQLVPDARIGVAHGQMEGARLEKTMMRFIEGDYDVLVSTNIIESGLDIPNANTIIINQAHMFGLSDLHQMRGRVGRSNRKAFCYLLTPPVIHLTSDARKRLRTLEEFSDLGDGFKVSMRDLDIRGAGNLLGSEQSGFINDLGFDLYHKILDEAVQELKETEFKDIFESELSKTSDLLVQDCVIESDLELIIPEDYVKNISERLKLYNELDNIKDEVKLQSFIENIKDRFGPVPASTEELINSVRLRWIAEKLGIDKLNLKNEKLKCYFSTTLEDSYFQSQVFGNILSFVQENPRSCKLKEIKNRLILIIDSVNSVQSAKSVLENIESRVKTPA